eukprot:1934205-Pyramimonas_sp.AAC.1
MMPNIPAQRKLPRISTMTGLDRGTEPRAGTRCTRRPDQDTQNKFSGQHALTESIGWEKLFAWWIACCLGSRDGPADDAREAPGQRRQS